MYLGFSIIDEIRTDRRKNRHGVTNFEFQNVTLIYFSTNV